MNASIKLALLKLPEFSTAVRVQNIYHKKKYHSEKWFFQHFKAHRILFFNPMNNSLIKTKKWKLFLNMISALLLLLMVLLRELPNMNFSFHISFFFPLLKAHKKISRSVYSSLLDWIGISRAQKSSKAVNCSYLSFHLLAIYILDFQLVVFFFLEKSQQYNKLNYTERKNSPSISLKYSRRLKNALGNKMSHLMARQELLNGSSCKNLKPYIHLRLKAYLKIILFLFFLPLISATTASNCCYIHISDWTSSAIIVILSHVPTVNRKTLTSLSHSTTATPTNRCSNSSSGHDMRPRWNLQNLRQWHHQKSEAMNPVICHCRMENLTWWEVNPVQSGATNHCGMSQTVQIHHHQCKRQTTVRIAKIYSGTRPNLHPSYRHHNTTISIRCGDAPRLKAMHMKNHWVPFGTFPPHHHRECRKQTLKLHCHRQWATDKSNNRKCFVRKILVAVSGVEWPITWDVR